MKTIAIPLMFAISLSTLAAEIPRQKQLIFIDPAHDRTVPVYTVDANGKPTKNQVTALIPGDMASVREIREDGTMIIRGRDLEGKEISYALDPATLKNDKGEQVTFHPGERAREMKVTGDGTARATNIPGLEKDVCALTTNACREYLSGDSMNVKDAVLAVSLDDSASGRPKVRNYYKNKDGMWVDSDSSSRVPMSWSNIVSEEEIAQYYAAEKQAESLAHANANTEKREDCPEDGTQPLASDQRNDLAAIASEAGKTAKDQQLKTIMAQVGTCHSMDVPNYHDRIVNSMAAKPVPAISKEVRAENGSVSTVPATKSDMVAIDVMARTLYGEMAGCFDDGIQYPEAVAKVVLNRADFANEHERRGVLFVKAGSENENRNDITNVLFKDKQFSTWNRDDRARRMTMCPPSNPDKNYWKGQKPEPAELKIWEQAVSIASQSVLNGETFRKRTKDLKALYYTSNFELSSKFKPIRNARIGGKAVPLGHCVQLWESKELVGVADQASIWHPLMEMALLKSRAAF